MKPSEIMKSITNELKKEYRLEDSDILEDLNTGSSDDGTYIEPHLYTGKHNCIYKWSVKKIVDLEISDAKLDAFSYKTCNVDELFDSAKPVTKIIVCIERRYRDIVNNKRIVTRIESNNLETVTYQENMPKGIDLIGMPLLEALRSMSLFHQYSYT